MSDIEAQSNQITSTLSLSRDFKQQQLSSYEQPSLRGSSRSSRVVGTYIFMISIIISTTIEIQTPEAKPAPYFTANNREQAVGGYYHLQPQIQNVPPPQTPRNLPPSLQLLPTPAFRLADNSQTIAANYELRQPIATFNDNYLRPQQQRQATVTFGLQAQPQSQLQNSYNSRFVDITQPRHSVQPSLPTLQTQPLQLPQVQFQSLSQFKAAQQQQQNAPVAPVAAAASTPVVQLNVASSQFQQLTKSFMNENYNNNNNNNNGDILKLLSNKTTTSDQQQQHTLHKALMSLQNPRLLGGDILLKTASRRRASNNNSNNYKNKGRLFKYERSALVSPISLWPNGLIYFELDPSVAHLSELIYKVMQQFHDETCIRFIQRQDGNEPDYLHIESRRGCFSYIGRIGGEQILSLGDGCEYRGTIAHELLHAVGFYHHQNRSDRDEFLDILWDNIAQDKKNQFSKMDPNDNVLLNDFDYNSIMLYGPHTFGKTLDRITMKPKREGVILLEVIEKHGLSALDIDSVNKLYKCGSSPYIE